MKQKNIIINGQDYLLTTFKATIGLKLLKQLTKLIGPAFLELQKVDMSEAKGKNAEQIKERLEEQAMMNAASVLIDNLDNVEVEALVFNLIDQGVTKGGMKLNFDIEFSGQFDVLFDLVKEVISFNYGNVFSKLGSGMGQQNLA